MGPHSSITGGLRSELLCNQETVEAVEDTGQTNCLPPQGRRDWVNGTELWDQNLGNSIPVSNLDNSGN